MAKTNERSAEILQGNLFACDTGYKRRSTVCLFEIKRFLVQVISMTGFSYSERENLSLIIFCRAIIKFHRTQMYAFFCDIAEIDTITDLKKIRPLPKEYLTIPKQAVYAKLFGIEPANGAWEMDDNIQFLRMTKGNKFMAEVVTVIHGKSEENSILEIILRHKQNVINDLFVASGRAIQSKSGKN